MGRLGIGNEWGCSGMDLTASASARYKPTHAVVDYPHGGSRTAAWNPRRQRYFPGWEVDRILRQPRGQCSTLDQAVGLAGIAPAPRHRGWKVALLVAGRPLDRFSSWRQAPAH